MASHFSQVFQKFYLKLNPNLQNFAFHILPSSSHKNSLKKTLALKLTRVNEYAHLHSGFLRTTIDRTGFPCNVKVEHSNET